jgi:hypothetical protein
MPGDSTRDKVQHCPPRDAAAKKTRTSAYALEMFTLCMNMTSKGESPRERQAHAFAHAHAENFFFQKFVNEVMPFLTSRSSSPRFRMESTAFLATLYAPPPTAFYITTATPPDAPAITSPTCPQTHKARLAASCLTSASRRHAANHHYPGLSLQVWWVYLMRKSYTWKHQPATTITQGLCLQVGWVYLLRLSYT